MASPDYGMQVFLLWREEIADRDLKLVEEAGFRWVKQEFAWREIEGAAPGVFDWDKTDRVMDQIDSFGLKVIARVGVQPEWAGSAYPQVGPPDDYQDFANFLHALATRYQGRIDAYQIWNEPNLAREWGSRPPNPAEYTDLLRVAYQTIKAVDPNAYIISAGLAPTTRWDEIAVPDTVFIQGMYDAGAAPYFDALAAHSYGLTFPPDDPPDPDVINFRRVELLREVMEANGDGDKPVFITEAGWNDHPRWTRAVRPAQRIRYTMRAYELTLEWPWLEALAIWAFRYPWAERNIRDYYTFVTPDFEPKPIYLEIKEALTGQTSGD